MKKYLIGILAITAMLLLIYYFDENIGIETHTYFIHLIVFFFLQSAVVAFLLHKGSKDPEKFPIYALGTIVFRLLTAIIFLTVFFVIGVDNASALAIQFIGIYLSFLVFELIVVLTNLRPN